MRRSIFVIACVCLMMLAACAPAQPAAPQQPSAPAAVPEVRPLPPAALPVSDPPEVTVVEMDADTQSRLKTAFTSSANIAVSQNFYKMKVGESKVFGVAFRAVNAATDSYQMRFGLTRAYDKSTNIITRETSQVQRWIELNGITTQENAFPIESLDPRGEKIYPFLIDVKPTLTDGTPTPPGSYEFHFEVFNKGPRAAITNPYAEIKITVLVEP